MHFAYYAHLGDPLLYQMEYHSKLAAAASQIAAVANKVLVEENSSVVYYKKR